jgi:hypothetical protein
MQVARVYNDYIEEHKLHQKYTESLIAASKLMESVGGRNERRYVFCFSDCLMLRCFGFNGFADATPYSWVNTPAF